MSENKKRQAFNPFLPSYEYVPDGEPHVFGDRVYLYGSHDRFNGSQYCMNNYVCYSAPVDDLTDWRYEGVIYRKEQDPTCEGDNIMQAPDVAKGLDGKYYLYYALGMIPFVSVAVADKPQGPFEYYGTVSYEDGTPVGMREHDVFMFDPGIFVDEDSRIWLYTGFAPRAEGIYLEFARQVQLDGAYVTELWSDMKTAKTEPKLFLKKAGDAEKTGFEGHEFYEAASMRKKDGIYYFVYSSIKSHELCYAFSKYPDREFQYSGILISNGNVGFEGNTEAQYYTGNTHGGLLNLKDRWYIFYHRQTNQHEFSRQACAEEITFKDGRFEQAEMTSCGLNGGPLKGSGKYPAYIACVLRGRDGAYAYNACEDVNAENYPYMTQTGEDRESDGDQFIANMRDGAVAGFKYFEFLKNSRFEIQVSGDADGSLEILTDPKGTPLAVIPFKTGKQMTELISESIPLEGKQAIYFKYKGTGFVNIHTFEIF